MQPFLAYPDFEESAAVLDNLRLKKQRVENLQIMQAVLGHRIVTSARKRIDHKLVRVELPSNEWKFEVSTGKAWVNHPAVLMWKKTPRALMEYQHAICDAWDALGYEDTCREKTERVLHQFRQCEGYPLTPFWLGNEKLHRSHRAALIRKNSGHYLPLFGPHPAMDYYWPVKARK